MRMNYDKPHRCPTWSGPAWKRGKGDCASESFASYMYQQPHWQWRTQHCRECGVITIPYVTRYVDPSWIAWRIKRRFTDWKYDREMRRAIYEDIEDGL